MLPLRCPAFTEVNVKVTKSLHYTSFVVIWPVIGDQLLSIYPACRVTIRQVFMAVISTTIAPQPSIQRDGFYLSWDLYSGSKRS